MEKLHHEFPYQTRYYLLLSPCPSAYNSLRFPLASQLANFHHDQCTLPPTFTKPQRTGLGMGGQSAHKPSSYSASRLSRKNGTTSRVPAFMTVFLPHALNTAAAFSASALCGAGADGCSAKAAMVLISLWKCVQKASWNKAIIACSCVPLKALGVPDTLFR